MFHIAFLAVCYKLGVCYGGSEFSKGYALHSRASERASREHSALNIGRVVEHLDNHTLYGQGSNFRNSVAYILNKMRKHRFDLDK